MANPLIEGPISLAGKGFVAKENGNFQPGEFKRLSNMEIDADGNLVNRRNVYSVHSNVLDSSVSPIVNPQRFLGHMGRYTLLTNGTDQYIMDDGKFVPGWNTFTGGPTDGGSFSRFVGFFRYNNKNHWIVLEYNAGDDIGLVIYHDAAIPVPDEPSTYGPGYQTSLTRTLLFKFALGTQDFYDFQFKNFFLYKDRLWIATSVGLYFSAATAPTNFTVPQGGFFKYPDNVVNYAMAVKDNIYILCDNAVYSLTYSTDPNTDSSQRPLSTIIGGETGCIHLDVPYFINNLGIFAINGGSVDKVMDSKFDYGTDYYRNRLFSFENYLIVNKYSHVNYDNNYTKPSRAGLRRNLWPTPVGSSANFALGASSPPLERYNSLINTSFGAAISNPDNGWEAGNSFTTISRVAPPAPLPIDYPTNQVCRVFKGTNTGTRNTVSLKSKPTSVGLFVVEGTASAWVRVSHARDVRIYIKGYALLGGEDYSISNTVSVPANTWTRISVTATGMDTSWSANVIIQFLNVGDSDSFEQWVGAVLLEQGTTEVRDFFDGNTTDTTLNTYSWDGTANLSTSTATFNSVAVPTISVVADNDGAAINVVKFSGEVNDTDALDPNFVPYTELVHTFNPTTAFTNGAFFGTPYKFHFKFKRVTGTNYTTKLIAKSYDVGNNLLGTSEFDVDTDGAVHSAFQTKTFTVTVPNNTEYIKWTWKISFTSTSTTNPFDFRLVKFHVELDSTYAGYFDGSTTDTANVIYSWTGTEFNSESTASPDTHGYLKNNGAMFDPFQAGNELGYNTFLINTDNGAVSVLDFVDQYGSYLHGGAGFIVDGFTNPMKDDSGNYKWLFITNKLISSTEAGLTFNSYVYYLSSSEDVEVNDFVFNSSNRLIRTSPKIDIEIDSFVPDGNEYRVKKFRSLEVMGVIPPVGISMQVGYDNSAYVQNIMLGDNETVQNSPRRHYAHRIGLNQRGRSLTLRFKNNNWLTSISADFGTMEISDIRTLWTYSGKHPSTKNIGS